MVSPLFDTYRAVNALREAGFPDQQAVALVDTIGGAIGGGLATKGDLAEVRSELKSDIAEVRADLTVVRADLATVKTDVATLKADVAAVKTDLAEFKEELYRHLWLMGMGIVTLNVGLTVALIKLLP